MFEWVFADVLGGYLEKYVVDFSSHNFRLAAWNGDIILKDLELRTDLLDTADLPVQVVRGRIGSLRIQVPWKSLWSAPVVMMIGNVDVQTKPRDESWSEDLEAKMKQSKLAAWEVCCFARRASPWTRRQKLTLSAGRFPALFPRVPSLPARDLICVAT